MDENEITASFSADVSLKQRLIMAGIDEIAANGIQALSLRKVAAACGVSCAAPYRHFKNKDEFISETVAFIKSQWTLLRDGIFGIYPDLHERLTETCVAYVRFLCANSSYITVLSQSREPIISDAKINEMIDKRCEELNILANERELKRFTVNAIVAGAVTMINSGGTPMEETLGLMRRSTSELI